MAAISDEITLESAFRREPILDLSKKNILIKGRYRILHLCFESTRTNVFQGIDLEQKRKVYVHVVKNQFFQRGRELKQWIQSIKVIQKLNASSGTFEILEMDLWKKKFFIVTDRYEGVPIFNLLSEQDELPLVFVLKLIDSMASLLQDALSKGFSSRLVSKEDLFVGRAGDVHLLRFAKGRVNQEFEEVEPELTDLYFLGTLMYELLTRESPFRDGREIESEKAHLWAVLKIRTNQSQKDIFESISELFVRLVGANAESRVSSLSELRVELKELTVRAVQLQEDFDERIEKEKLNSAFDVVHALRGDVEEEHFGSESEAQREIPFEQEGSRYSRVWASLDVGSKAFSDSWDMETMFRWAAVLFIIASFLYKFYG